MAGTALLRIPKAEIVLGQAANYVASPTDTVENVILTVPLPAIGGGDWALELEALLSLTSSGNNKTIRWRAGGTGTDGTAFMAVVLTATATYEDRRIIRNRSAAAFNVGFPAASGIGLGTSAGGVVSGTVDFSTAKNLYLTVQKATGAEVCDLQGYSVIYRPKP